MEREWVEGRGWQQACVRGRGAFILGCGPEASIELGLGLDHRERGEAQMQNHFLLGREEEAHSAEGSQGSV